MVGKLWWKGSGPWAGRIGTWKPGTCETFGTYQRLAVSLLRMILCCCLPKIRQGKASPRPQALELWLGRMSNMLMLRHMEIGAECGKLQADADAVAVGV